MKKLAVIIMALIMTASLASCGGSGEGSNTSETSVQNSSSVTSETKAEEAEPEETKAEETTPEETESSELKTADSGEGEKKLESVFCDVIIPEGLKYDVYLYSHDEKDLGTLKINFGKSNALEGGLEVSTTRMVKSLDDAVNECIKVRNLDTYKEGKSEIGEEVTYGDTTYKEVKMSHEYGAETCLVSYYQRADGKDVYVEIKTTQNDFSKLELDDPLIVELAKSAVYK